MMHTHRWINSNSSTLIVKNGSTQSGDLPKQHSPEAKSSHLILPGQTIPAPRKNQSLTDERGNSTSRDSPTPKKPFIPLSPSPQG